MLGELVAENRRRALREADLEAPTPAAPLARIERHPYRLRRVEPGQSVDDDRADAVRCAVIAEIERDISPEKACATESVQGTVGVGPFLTKAADRR